MLKEQLKNCKLQLLTSNQTLMKKITLLLLLLQSIVFAQQTRWEKASAQNLTPLKQVERSNFPKDFQLFATNITTLKSALQSAPNRLTASQSTTVVRHLYIPKLFHYNQPAKPTTPKKLVCCRCMPMTQ